MPNPKLKINEESKNSDIVTKPKIGDKKWTDYVLEQLEEGELFEGKYPTVNGLRRITPSLLKGKFITQESIVHQVPCESNAYSATVMHRITVEIEHLSKESTILIAEGCADASSRNLNGAYENYPTAMAETRAEGRALRRLLNVNLVVKEEIDDGDLNLNTYNSPNKINDIQIQSLNKQCNQLNIDLEKFLALAKGIAIDNLPKISREVTLELLEILSGYIADNNSIPKEISIDKI